MIIIKSDREIALMREAGKVTGEILRELSDYIKPGITTFDINAYVEDKIAHYKMIPTFKGYGGFPAGACVSVNEEIVHGIPSKKRKLYEGDIVSVDTGATYRGYVSDAARTYSVGEIDDSAKKLIDVTKQSFFEGIKYAKVGFRLHDIGEAIQRYAEANGMGVIREYLGHGLGKNLHEDPPVPNYKDEGMSPGPHLKQNMVIAIEPMLSIGSYGTLTMDNDWTVITDDNSLSAHYENTVVINDGEPELLTL